MKNTVVKNYFSHIALGMLAIAVFFSFAPMAFAQLSYAGKQIMYWDSKVCNNSNTNVHFLLLNGSMLLTLYSSPGTRIYQNSDINFGISQVGTYTSTPVSCVANISGAPVVLLVTNGTYIDATTGYTTIDQGIFLAGGINPFIQSIEQHA